MHGRVGPTIGDRSLNGGHEDTLPTDLIERFGQVIACCADDLDLHLESGMSGPQRVGHQVGLVQRER